MAKATKKKKAPSKKKTGPAARTSTAKTKAKASTAAGNGAGTSGGRRAKRYWLMKSEPEGYSIQDLERERRAEWDGVRNYQARNFMRDEMAVGDEVLFYHSSADPTGVVGLARVSRRAAPDVTALDATSKYYDPKATEEEPRWYCVQVEHVETFPATVPLAELKRTPGLEEMLVTQRGQRLSIQPVTKAEFEIVRKLGRTAAKA